MDWTSVQNVLAGGGVKFAPGLTAEEFAAVERQFGFRFPPDLHEFLSLGLPVSDGWVNWRSADLTSIRKRLWRRADLASIRKRLDWPLEGICFDIEHADFWMEKWGRRPGRLADAFEIARKAVAEAPVLIPVYVHRYLPATPLERGNPVFSVYQTDVIYYGTDLFDYLQAEFYEHFGLPQRYAITAMPRRIPFWSRLVELNG